MSQRSTLICRNHPNLSWSCKSIAVDTDGRYNGSRNIFFQGKPGERECSCDSCYLIDESIYVRESEADRSANLFHLNKLMEKTEMTHTADNAMQAALIQAGITEENTEQHEFCDATKKQIAFGAAGLAGMICTRIQRLATGKFALVGAHDAEEHFQEYGKYPDGSKEECRHEMRELAANFNWRLLQAKDEIGHGCDMLEAIVEPMIEEWLGGGFSPTKIKDEQLAGYVSLGYTKEEAINMVQSNRMATRDYLAVKREHLGSIMLTQLCKVLEATEPKMPENIKDIIQNAYNFAVTGGRVTDAILIKHDATSLGLTLDKVVITNDNAEQARRIREKLAERQEERARQEAKALADFDILAA